MNAPVIGARTIIRDRVGAAFYTAQYRHHDVWHRIPIGRSRVRKPIGCQADSFQPPVLLRSKDSLMSDRGKVIRKDGGYVLRRWLPQYPGGYGSGFMLGADIDLIVVAGDRKPGSTVETGGTVA
ncbi:hypothetical protein PQR75_27310 [Paraburkholderia fungorum]|uniref:hypothetical protein n=2 Tax=Paraburkholderia fungorum TaxID=134537 RepID=UPI0038BB9A79